MHPSHMPNILPAAMLCCLWLQTCGYHVAAVQLRAVPPGPQAPMGDRSVITVLLKATYLEALCLELHTLQSAHVQPFNGPKMDTPAAILATLGPMHAAVQLEPGWQTRLCIFLPHMPQSILLLAKFSPAGTEFSPHKTPTGKFCSDSMLHPVPGRVCTSVKICLEPSGTISEPSNPQTLTPISIEPCA